MPILDTSVALVHLPGETRATAASLWEEPLVSSRLLTYELRTRLHARPRPSATLLGAADDLVAHLTLVELGQESLRAAQSPRGPPGQTGSRGYALWRHRLVLLAMLPEGPAATLAERRPRRVPRDTPPAAGKADASRQTRLGARHRLGPAARLARPRRPSR